MTLSDLDELVLRCREANSRQYIRESVASYRAGATRASIVTTWVAVVLDIVSKLHELDLAGDKQAHQQIQQLDKWYKNGAVANLLDFERNVLDDARDKYDLLTHTEHAELLRLRNDRNRCAHPSMLTSGEIYSPPAELARYHIANAVTMLLSRPPLQGKAAFERIWREIESAYFPFRPDAARRHLESGPLGSARPTLIRDLVKALTKAVLLDPVPDFYESTLGAVSLLMKGMDVDQDEDELRLRELNDKKIQLPDKQLAALSAIIEMHREVAEGTLQQVLPGLVARVEDDEWERVLHYVESIPVAWDFLSQAFQEKARSFIKMSSGRTRDHGLSAALAIPQLHSVALSEIEFISSFSICHGLMHDHPEQVPIEALVSESLRRFCNSWNYKAADWNMNLLILNAVPYLSLDQQRIVLTTFADNHQIWGSPRLPTMLIEFLQLTDYQTDGLEPEWRLVFDRVAQDVDEEYGRELLEVLSNRFPSFVEE